MNRFGASAPAELLFEKFGFSVENITKKACEMVGIAYLDAGVDCKL